MSVAIGQLTLLETSSLTRCARSTCHRFDHGVNLRGIRRRMSLFQHGTARGGSFDRRENSSENIAFSRRQRRRRGIESTHLFPLRGQEVLRRAFERQMMKIVRRFERLFSSSISRTNDRHSDHTRPDHDDRRQDQGQSKNHILHGFTEKIRMDRMRGTSGRAESVADVQRTKSSRGHGGNCECLRKESILVNCLSMSGEEKRRQISLDFEFQSLPMTYD